MTDSIPDGFLTNGLIVFGGPAGGLTATGFEIEMPNLQSASYGECNRVQDGIANMLQQLPERMKLQVIQFQAPIKVERLLDYQRQTEACQNSATRTLRNANFIQQAGLREAGKLLSKRVLIYISRPAPTAQRSPAKGNNAEHHYDFLLTDARSAFKEFEQSLVQALLPMGARVTPLTDPENARLWADALNPSLARSANYDPAAAFDPNRSLLDNFFNSELRGLGRQGFVLDGFHHLAITVRRLPTETYPTIVHRLTYLPFSDFTITVHLGRLPKDEVLKRTQSSLDRLHQQLLRKPDERQAVTVRQMQEKVRRLAAGEAVPLEMEIILLLRAKSEEDLAHKAAAIKSTLKGMNGMQHYEATLSATSRHLFVKTLPGWMGSRHQGFRLYCEDRSAADLLPMCSSFSGHPGPVQAIFPGNDHNLVNAVMFLGEGDAATPQNYVFVGANGVGKSLTLGKVLIETDSQFSFTAIIEEGLSQAPYPRSHGIEPVVFRVDGSQTLNPHDTQGLPMCAFLIATQTSAVARMVGLPADADKARRRSALISRQLGTLCQDHAEQHLRNWPLEKRNALLRHALALNHFGKQRGLSEFEAFGAFNELGREKPAEAGNLLNQFSQAQLDEFESVETPSVRNLVFAYLRPEEHFTLSSLREHFALAEEDEEECRWLATLLSPWCRGGNYGSLFDGPSTVSLNGAVVHYELGFIPEAAKEMKEVLGFLIINGVRNKVLTLPRHVKKRVVVEEVSRFLDVPGGEAILRELFEQFRKFNVQVVIVAQQYSRIADSPIRAALMGNTRAWFIFNTGDRRDVERLCEDLGLSKVAQEAILRFPRPDQQTGPKYSEFLYFHTDARQPICGTVRYVRLPHETPVSNQPSTQSNHA